MAPTRLVPWTMLVVLGLLGCNGQRSPLSLSSGPSGDYLLGVGGQYDRAPVVAQGDDTYILPMQHVQLRLNEDLSGELLFPHSANAFGQLLTADIDQLVPQRNIRLQSVTRSPAGNFVVDLEVEHPFPAPDLSGVVSPTNRADLHANHLRAIFFLDGNEGFTVSGNPVTVNPGLLVNADGYTDQVPPPTGASLNATAFPYVVFGTEDSRQLTNGNFHITDAGGLGWNHVPTGETRNRLEEPLGFNVFRQGGLSRGTFEFKIPNGGGASLDFLLVVNYSPAARSKSQRLTPEYFLPANAPQEAWRVLVNRTAGQLEAGPSPGSPQFANSATYQIEVYDWQHGHSGDVVSDFPRSTFRVGLAAASDIQSVRVVAPGFIGGTLSLPVPPILPEDAPMYGSPQVFEFSLNNATSELPIGTYYGLVEVTDSRTPDVDLTTLGDSKSVFGVDASTLEFRTLPVFRTWQVFPLEVVEGNVAPVAAAVATSSTSILQGQTVSFESQSTDDNGDALTYEWDFDGDGQFNHPVKDAYTGAPDAPTATFLAAGSFSVNLRVSDGRGGTDTLNAAGVSPFIRIPVTVGAQNIPPVACFSIVTPTDYLTPGAIVTFDASCSFDTSVPLIYEWDFDNDGVFGDAWHASSPAPPVTVSYQCVAADKYSVSVRVREASTPELYSNDAPYQDFVVRGPGAILTNPTGGSPRYFGKTLAMGDLNNDGLDDLVVAATGFHNVPTEEQPGRVYVYLNTGGDPPYSSTPTTIITAAHGGGQGAYGVTVAIGDVNNDGYGDIAVGQYQALSFQGYAEVIVNQGAAAAPFYFRTAATAGRPIQVIPVINPTPESGSESFGNIVDFIDVDGDGFDDLAVGAYAAARPGGHWQAGECYLFHSDGVTLTKVAVLQKFPALTADYLGTGIVAGDFDGDGDLDIVGGAPGTKVSGVTGAGVIAYWENKMGEVGITAPYYFGGDATNNNVIQRYLATAPAIVGDGAFGQVLKAADLNNDGYWELLVGSPGYYTGNDQVKSGRVFIYPGNPNFSNIFPAPIQQLRSSAPKFRAFFGSSIALGDVTGDGVLDLAVGSPFRDESSTVLETGFVELFRGLGSTFTTTATIVTPPNQSHRGESGFAVAIGDAFVGQNFKEVVYGAPRQTTYPTGPGRVHISRGPY